MEMTPGTYETLYALMAWAGTLSLVSLYQCSLLRAEMNLGGDVHRFIHIGAFVGTLFLLAGAGVQSATRDNNSSFTWQVGKLVWSMSTLAGGAMVAGYVWLMLRAKYEGVKMQQEPRSVKVGLFVLWFFAVITTIVGRSLRIVYKNERYVVIANGYFVCCAIGIGVILIWHSRVLIAGINGVLANEPNESARKRWKEGLWTFKKRLLVMAFIFLVTIGIMGQSVFTSWAQGSTPKEEGTSYTSYSSLFIYTLVTWAFWLDKKGSKNSSAGNMRERNDTIAGVRHGHLRKGRKGNHTSSTHDVSPTITANTTQKAMNSEDLNKLDSQDSMMMQQQQQGLFEDSMAMDSPELAILVPTDSTILQLVLDENVEKPDSTASRLETEFSD